MVPRTGLRLITLALAAAVAAPLVAQVQTDVPPVVAGAKRVGVERVKIHVPQTIEGAFAQGAQEMIVVLPDSKTGHNGSMTT